MNLEAVPLKNGMARFAADAGGIEACLGRLPISIRPQLRVANSLKCHNSSAVVPISMSEGRPVPIKIFFSYTHKDDRARDRLAAHLAVAKRQGLVKPWHDRKIVAGADWEGDIDDHLNSADIIVLLISADFIAAKYCWDKEMARALERGDVLFFVGDGGSPKLV